MGSPVAWTLASIVRTHAASRGDHPMLTFGERTVTYGQMDAASSRVAQAVPAVLRRHNQQVCALLLGILQQAVDLHVHRQPAIGVDALSAARSHLRGQFVLPGRFKLLGRQHASLEGLVCPIARPNRRPRRRHAARRIDVIEDQPGARLQGLLSCPLQDRFEPARVACVGDDCRHSQYF